MDRYKNILFSVIFALISLSIYATDPLKIPDAPPMLKTIGVPDEGWLFETDIDLLIVYTAGAKQWASTRGGIDTLIAQGMRLANLTMKNSETGVTFHLLKAHETDYTETGNTLVDLRRLTFGYDMAFDGYGTVNYMAYERALRDSLGADLVILVPSVGNSAGLAWQLSQEGGRPNYGYSVVMVHYINQLTFPHELGHNMGAHHNFEQLSSPGPGLFPYSSGWRWTANNKKYVSVMSYPSGYADGFIGTRVGYFSNPLINFIGVPTGDSLLADNARTIRRTKLAVSLYRDRKEDTIPPLPPPQSIPRVRTGEVTDITSNSAVATMFVDDWGNSPIVEYGVLWAEHDNPTLDDNFSRGHVVELSLPSNTEIFLRGYAINEVGMGVGEVISFKTLNPVPVVTVSLNELTHERFEVIMTIAGTHDYKELRWDSTPKLRWGGYTPYMTFQVWGLKPETTYYVRAGASNESGIGYSDTLVFTTKEAPTFINPPEITDEVIVYPNPSQGLIYITFKGIFKFQVWRVAPTTAMVMSSSKYSQITSINLPRGTYVIKVFTYGKNAKWHSFTVVVQ